MRKYQPLWDAIKINKTATIDTPVKNQERVVKAVRKEKATDLAWKLITSESGKRYKLEDKRSGTKVTFTLIEDNSTYISDMKL